MGRFAHIIVRKVRQSPSPSYKNSQRDIELVLMRSMIVRARLAGGDCKPVPWVSGCMMVADPCANQI